MLLFLSYVCHERFGASNLMWSIGLLQILTRERAKPDVGFIFSDCLLSTYHWSFDVIFFFPHLWTYWRHVTVGNAALSFRCSNGLELEALADRQRPELEILHGTGRLWRDQYWVHQRQMKPERPDWGGGRSTEAACVGGYWSWKWQARRTDGDQTGLCWRRERRGVRRSNSDSSDRWSYVLSQCKFPTEIECSLRLIGTNTSECPPP